MLQLKSINWLMNSRNGNQLGLKIRGNYVNVFGRAYKGSIGILFYDDLVSCVGLTMLNIARPGGKLFYLSFSVINS